MNPNIGIALGSGSARGFAHIGVLNALHQLDIEPAFITGCSIGSLVGAIYAAGRLLDFEQWIINLSKREMAGLMDVSIKGGGVLSGVKLMKHLRQFGLSQDIESLPKPFAAVATDLYSGREVWMQKGSVEDAVRASIALPGLLKPVLHHGRWLVDGGLVDPVPVSLCRALGADIVLAVNLNHDLMHVKRHEPSEPSGIQKGLNSILSSLVGRGSEPGFYDVLSHSIKIMQDRITRARAVGDPADLMFEPNLGGIALYDFDMAKAAIEAGRAAVFSRQDELLSICKF